VYTPPGQLIGAQFPSVYIHDGGDYLNLIDTRKLLDRLISMRRIPPLVAVFIPPIDRRVEYARNDAYARFVAEEVVPFVQMTYDTDPAPDKTATLGASMGGLISLHLGLRYPQTFGLVGSQSGAYTLDQAELVEEIERGSADSLRIYLVVGTYDTGLINSPYAGNFLAANQAIAGALTAGGYQFSYGERPEGHSWGLWEATLADALGYLFP
jgi:enterochelin esterase-like enzyme